jgi:hypothetical protein
MNQQKETRVKRFVLVLLAFFALHLEGAVSTCVISGTVVDGGAAPVANAEVRIRTIRPALVGGSGVTSNDLKTRTAIDGTWSLTVIQGLNAQVDIPAVGIASDFVVPTTCPALFSGLTLNARGTLTPATILSDHGPSFGGDLSGSSPNPTVVAIQGKAVSATAPTNGQALVWNTSNSRYEPATPAGTGVTSVSGGTGITVTGTTAPSVALSAGGVTATQLGSGAASTNVGTLAGDLSGTLPSPAIATGAVTDAKVATGAAIAWTKVSKVGAVAADVGAVAAGVGLTGVTAGAGLTVTGTAPSPTVAVTAGGIGPTQLATGAASTNVGSLGGVLSGTLPSPSFAAGALVNADVNPLAGIAWSKVSKAGAAAGDVGAVPAAAVIAAVNSSSETPKISPSQLQNIAESQVTNLVADLAAKRGVADAIAQSDVTGLVAGLAAKEATANKGQPNGYASLDGTGKVPVGLLPSFTASNGVDSASGTAPLTLSIAGSYPSRALSGSVATFSDVAAGVVPASGGGTSNFLRADGTWQVAGTGTVSSVGLTLPGEITVTGTPVTTSGTLAGTWATQTAAKVFASPAGTTGTPSFRALVTGDLPANPTFTTVTATTFTGALTGNASTATSATSATSATTLTGSLTGDVTNAGMTTTVATVGGATAANVASATTAANAAASINTVGTIVKRDGSGNFAAGTITATLSGAATSAGTATTAGDGLTSATGTAPLVLTLGAKALTGSVGTFDATHAGIVPMSGGGTTNFLRADGTWTGPPGGGGGGSGTVTSVGLSLPAQFTVTGTPVTGTGTLSGSWANATQNSVFAGLAAGGAGTPSFRSLVQADLPATWVGPVTGNVTGNVTGSAGSITGTLPLANLTNGTTGVPLLGGASAPAYGTLGVSGGGTGLTSLGGALMMLRTNLSGTALEYVTFDKNVIGLSNVDNTSDVTKNAAAVVLTNKQLDSPVFNGTVTTISNTDFAVTPNGTGKVAFGKQVNFATTATFTAIVDNGNSGSTKTIDWTAGNKQKITTTAACTLTFTPPPGPASLTLIISHDATASVFSYTWPGTVKWPGGVKLATTNTASAVDIVSLVWNGTAYYAAGTADLR